MRECGIDSGMIRTMLHVAAMIVVAALSGCDFTPKIDDPIATLQDPEAGRRSVLRAMELTDTDPMNEDRLAALHGMIWRSGYQLEVREAALDRLAETDLETLKVTLRQRLPRLTEWGWLTRLSEIIAERGWKDLTPPLINSWARPATYIPKYTDRPEYKALVSMHGESGVPDAMFDLLLTARAVHEQGLRSRCWRMLNELGYRDRLVELLRETEIPEDDLFLRDLRRAALDLSIIPTTREEILWVRKLREQQRATFWEQAKRAVAMLPEARREELELRDLGVLVAASIHEPELLTASREVLYRRVNGYVESEERHIASRSYEGYIGNYDQHLHQHRDRLTWGDLAAMLVAVRAMQVPQVVDHLFSFADRDLAEDSTEFGGIIALDSQNRFEILEFVPRIRQSDDRFIASQAMFDAGYTAVFHFHYHAQKHRNRENAGPGIGDVQYASETRTNNLVLTFVNSQALNIDFYRHGPLIVDLGEVRRQ